MRWRRATRCATPRISTPTSCVAQGGMRSRPSWRERPRCRSSTSTLRMSPKNGARPSPSTARVLWSRWPEGSSSDKSRAGARRCARRWPRRRWRSPEASHENAMLTTADADVVRRDPALPGLAAILDPIRLAELLRPLLPESAIGAGRVGWIRYKVNESCRAAYRFDTVAGKVEIGLHACLPDDLAERRGNGNGVKRLVLEDLALVA